MAELEDSIDEPKAIKVEAPDQLKLKHIAFWEHEACPVFPKFRTWVRFHSPAPETTVDAVGFTGFPPQKSLIISPILDAVGREIHL